MIKESNSRQKWLAFKIIACLFGLIVVFTILSPKVFLQKKSSKPKKDAISNSLPNFPRNTYKNYNVNMMNSYNGNYSYTPPPTTNVRGKVIFEDTGQPVRRANITLLGKMGRISSESVLTDYNGNFLMKNVVPDTYFPLVDSPGVLNPMAFMAIENMADENQEELFFGELEKNFQSLKVNGEKTLDFKIVAKRGGVISGQAKYADDNPAGGVTIEISRKVGEKYIPVTTDLRTVLTDREVVIMTDERGMYRISGLPTGEYLIKAIEAANHNHNGNELDSYTSLVPSNFVFSLLSIFYPNAETIENAQKIEVKIGQEVSNIDIKIPIKSLHSIKGKVVSEKTKEPLENITIQLVKVGYTTPVSLNFRSNPNVFIETYTNSNGEWSFNEIPNGNYKILINVSSSNDPEVADEYLNVDGTPSNPMKMSSNTMTNAVNTTYAANRAAEVANAVNRANSSANRAAQVANMAMRNANAMASNVKVSPTPYQSKIHYFGIEKEIRLTDETEPNLTLELPVASKIEGRVRLENNAKLPGVVWVEAIDEQNIKVAIEMYYAYIYGKSPKTFFNFSLDRLGLQDIYLDTTFGYDRDSYYLKSIKSKGEEFLGKPFSITKTVEIKNVEVILSSDGGKLSGQVISIQNNAPLPNAALLLIPADEKMWKVLSWRRRVWANKLGEFNVSLVPTDYLIFIFRPEDKPFKIDEKWIKEHQANAQKVSIQPKQTQTIQLKF